jgi:hypothetical protein
MVIESGEFAVGPQTEFTPVRSHIQAEADAPYAKTAAAVKTAIRVNRIGDIRASIRPAGTQRRHIWASATSTTGVRLSHDRWSGDLRLSKLVATSRIATRSAPPQPLNR